MDAISYSYADKQAKRIKKFINNPDSNSGIVTVPKVIGAGENITIPAGRVAVLPNVQIDGTLNVEGEVFIPSGATLSKVVETEGNQTIDGIKTFSSSPIVPTPTADDNSTKVANTAFVKAKCEAVSIGVNQTWQNMIASRSMGVTYTNNTGKPICVSVLFDAPNAGSTFRMSIDGKIVDAVTISNISGDSSVGAIVPHLSTYTVAQSYLTGGTVGGWVELR